MTGHRHPYRPRIWTAPITLAVLSAIGLTAALVADGAGDVVAWLALAAPIAVAAWHSLR
ncbi:MAG: hypothetical protein JXB36_14730 [Gammaproteobacteria bacterium]|nr:hypothetical protein [Gammaproteobacteria bacterium]